MDNIKYKNIINLNKTLKLVANRCLKELTARDMEFSRSTIFHDIKDRTLNCLRNDKLNINESINDVIDIIIEEGELNGVEELIDEYNYANRKVKQMAIKTKNDLIKCFKSKMSIKRIFTEPIFFLFYWNQTKRGNLFYENLNTKVSSRLNELFNIDNHIINLVRTYVP
jgi:hypothetical protein